MSDTPRGVGHGKLVALALTISLASCGGDRLPVSPSAVAAPVAAWVAATSAPSDYHEIPDPDPSPVPDPDPSPAPTPTPTPTPSPAPGELQGTWVTVYGGQQATLVLGETGYEVFYGPEYHIGAIAVRGDQIEFSQGSSCAGSGTYRWSLEGDALVFRAVGRDSCPGRSTALNNRTYTRSS